MWGAPKRLAAHDCTPQQSGIGSAKKVATLLVYLAINVVLATVLEKQSKKTANIFHAVLFFFTLGLLLLATDDGVLQDSLVSMLGQKTYDAVTMVVLGTKLSAVLPLLVVEVALVLQTLLVAMFTVQRIVTDRKSVGRERVC